MLTITRVRKCAKPVSIGSTSSSKSSAAAFSMTLAEGTKAGMSSVPRARKWDEVPQRLPQAAPHAFVARLQIAARAEATTGACTAEPPAAHAEHPQIMHWISESCDFPVE